MPSLSSNGTAIESFMTDACHKTSDLGSMGTVYFMTLDRVDVQVLDQDGTRIRVTFTVRLRRYNELRDRDQR